MPNGDASAKQKKLFIRALINSGYTPAEARNQWAAHVRDMKKRGEGKTPFGAEYKPGRSRSMGKRRPRF